MANISGSLFRAFLYRLLFLTLIFNYAHSINIETESFVDCNVVESDVEDDRIVCSDSGLTWSLVGGDSDDVSVDSGVLNIPSDVSVESTFDLAAFIEIELLIGITSTSPGFCSVTFDGQTQTGASTLLQFTDVTPEDNKLLELSKGPSGECEIDVIILNGEPTAAPTPLPTTSSPTNSPVPTVPTNSPVPTNAQANSPEIALIVAPICAGLAIVAAGVLYLYRVRSHQSKVTLDRSVTGPPPDMKRSQGVVKGSNDAELQPGRNAEKFARPTSTYMQRLERNPIKSIFRPSSTFLSQFRNSSNMNSKKSKQPRERNPFDDIEI